MHPPTLYTYSSQCSCRCIGQCQCYVPGTVSMKSQWCVSLLADHSACGSGAHDTLLKEVRGCVCSMCAHCFMLCLNRWLFWTVYNMSCVYTYVAEHKHTPCPLVCWQRHYSDTWHSKKSDVTVHEWSYLRHCITCPRVAVLHGPHKLYFMDLMSCITWPSWAVFHGSHELYYMALTCVWFPQLYSYRDLESVMLYSAMNHLQFADASAV